MRGAVECSGQGARAERVQQVVAAAQNVLTAVFEGQLRQAIFYVIFWWNK